MKKSPRRASPPEYPTLSEFAMGRRAFLRLLGVSAAVVVTGSWTALARAESPDDEMITGGAEAMPEFWAIKVPHDGQGVAYLNSGELLRFEVNLSTYDDGFVAFANAPGEPLLDTVLGVFANQTCEALSDPGGVTKVESALVDAITAHYKRTSGQEWGAMVAELSFTMHHCESEIRMRGDVASPTYPEPAEGEGP